MTEAALYIVATPIGNLGDLSPRAIDVLQQVAVIAAEDTRHSQVLLKHFGIATPCMALHEHNEEQASAKLIARLQRGDSVALISDAGTPLISDPGYRLVRAAQQAACRVIAVPGPSALIAALSVSGLPSDRFIFEGFLPARSAARHKRLQQLHSETRTLIFYESPHRILDTLADMAACLGGERPAVLARELTKRFETILADDLGGLIQRLQADPQQQKGEMVILLQGAAEQPQTDDAELTRLLSILLTELPVKQAVSLAVQISERKKNEVYALAVKLKENNGPN